MRVIYLSLSMFLMMSVGCVTTKPNKEVYVYSNGVNPNFVLDTVDNHAGINGSGYFLKDCSTDDFDCIESPIFNFSFPKASETPKRWVFNGIKYEVTNTVEHNQDKVFEVALEVTSDISRLVLENITKVYYSKANGIVKLKVGHFNRDKNIMEFFDYELIGSSGFQFEQ